ncbi:transferase [Ideonella sp.]|uniref:spermine/spermidine synthase domain-containing protein n=1 Tax=Ideonella sp. TaxID=1929293 RepID=UPI002B49AE4F|nr:transferase [Ideonella sp.]HJV68162.1 transferase [Ideonella sp.]
MPETLDPAQHVKPYVYESLTSKALHFSISEIQSRMRLADPYALDLEYTRLMMGFVLFHPQPKQIVMIGLGGGSLAKFCHRHLPDTHIQVVEINPHVIALRDEFHVPPDSERFHVVPGDGARYVRLRARRPDVLVVDGFGPDGQPARLCSQRFYDDCAEMLQPGGVLVVNLHRGHRHYDVFIDRIQRSFGGSALAVEDSEGSNGIVFACKGYTLDKAAAGLLRKPTPLPPAAATPLQAALARVKRALEKQRHAG